MRQVHAITVASGQVEREWEHLLRKLASRNPARFEQWASVRHPELHPLFHAVPGPVASWEKAQ